MDNKPTGKPMSLHEAMFLRKLGSTPSSRVLASAALPKIPAPSLDALALTCPTLQLPTPDEIFARFEELCFEHAPRRKRETGEAVFEGDDAILDMAAYHQGQLIPFSVKRGAPTTLLAGFFLPGFAEAIWGHQVGSNLAFRITLPDDYPLEILRGKDVSYAVTIVAATEIGEFDIDSDDFVRSLGLGNTHEEVMQAIGKQLTEEAVARRQLELGDQAMAALVQRAQVHIPDSVVDVEIGKRWHQLEGAYLESIGAEGAERDSALVLWLDDPAVREDAKARLAAQQVVTALAEAHQATLNFGQAHVKQFMELISQRAGVSTEELKKELADNPADTTAVALANQALTFEVIDFVLSKAQIRDAWPCPCGALPGAQNGPARSVDPAQLGGKLSVATVSNKSVGLMKRSNSPKMQERSETSSHGRGSEGCRHRPRRFQRSTS